MTNDMNAIDYNDIKKRVMEYLETFQRNDYGKLTEDTRLRDDIGLDSLDYMQIVLELEEMFSIQINEDEESEIGDMTIKSLSEMVMKKLNSGDSNAKCVSDKED